MRTHSRKRTCCWLASFWVFAILLGESRPASALSFTVNYDDSVAGAPAGLKPAFESAVHVLELLYVDPIIINLNVGWGEINGGPLTFAAQSQTVGGGLRNYSTIKAALSSDAKSAADAAAVASLPAVDPTGGGSFAPSRAQAKALGLISGNAAGTDGWVGFSTGVNWNFDIANRSIAGEEDFVGAAEHEITEVMGRYGLLQINGAFFGVIDLFRYSAPVARYLAQSRASGTYFSIDNGATKINTFNGSAPFDFSDWAPQVPDAFNAFGCAGCLGLEEPLSAGDVLEMDVLGYDPAVPEPSTVLLLGGGLLVVTRKRFRIAVTRPRVARGAH